MKMKRIIPALSFLLISAALIFPAGGKEADKENKGFTVTDSYDRKIDFEETPARVISTAPGITEIIYMLGKGDLLVGRTDYCDYPEEAASVQSIGGLENPNIEKIVELNPDVVIASTHFRKEDAEALDELGIKLVVFTSEQSFEGTYSVISAVGSLLDAEDKAREHIAKMKADVEYVKSIVTKASQKPKVYYVIGFGQYGDYTAGGDTFIGKMLEMAGGANIASELSGWAYSFEKIVEHNPDIIICSKFWGTGSELEMTDGYRDLDAVRNGSVYEIDNNMIDRQGPRLAEALVMLAGIFHPELFD